MTQTIEQLTARVRELEEENARLKRTNSSYVNLTKAQESQLTNLRQRLYQLKGADSAIDSERQANCELTEQLAAEQLNNKLLRDALQAYIDEHEECQDADDWMAMMCSMEAHHTADEALSQPSDTSALDTFVAEKVKEQVSELVSTGNKVMEVANSERLRLYSVTKQRDLAVDAITRAIDMVGHPDNITYLQQTLDAIKESEAK